MCRELHSIDKDIKTIVGDRPISHWLFTYVRGRKYYEFSGISATIPWETINKTIVDDDPSTWEDAVYSPLKYYVDTEDDVWTGYVVFEGGVDWVCKRPDMDMTFTWKEGAGTPPQKEHNLDFNVYRA